MSTSPISLQKQPEPAPEDSPDAAVAEHWHYVQDGVAVGPVSTDALLALIHSQTLGPDSLLWSGQGDWTPAHQTRFAAHWLPQDGAARPAETPQPGVPGFTPETLGVQAGAAAVEDRWVWAMVAVPLAVAVLERLTGWSLWWLAIGLNTGLALADEYFLKKSGHPAPDKWWTLLVPVYLWQRAQLLRQPLHYFWAWMASFALSLVLALFGGKAALEEGACSTVTDIVQQQLYQRQVSCKKVSLGDEIGEGFYEGSAVLSNGRRLRITVQQQDDGSAYVQIPYDQ